MSMQYLWNASESKLIFSNLAITTLFSLHEQYHVSAVWMFTFERHFGTIANFYVQLVQQVAGHLANFGPVL